MQQSTKSNINTLSRSRTFFLENTFSAQGARQISRTPRKNSCRRPCELVLQCVYEPCQPCTVPASWPNS